MSINSRNESQHTFDDMASTIYQSLFSGADLRALVADAALSAIHRAIEGGGDDGGGGGGEGDGAPAVTRGDMDRAMSEVGRCRLKHVEPRVESAWFLLFKLTYDNTSASFAFKFNLHHTQRRGRASPDRSASASPRCTRCSKPGAAPAKGQRGRRCRSRDASLLTY